MKNIYEIMKSFGLEVPDDKKEAFDKAVAENYKTIAEVNGINKKLETAETERDTYKTKYDDDIKKRDEDLATLKKQLEDAGTDKATIETLTKNLSDLQTTYDNDKTNWQKQLDDTRYEYAVKEKVEGLKFSSNSAKKAFMAELKEKPLQMRDGVLTGFDDFVNAYKSTDADAFMKEDNASNNANEGSKKPSFAGASTGNVGGTNNNDDNSSNITTTSNKAIIW